MNSSLPAPFPVIVAPGEGRVIRAFGSEMVFHLTGAETEGRQMLATIIAPPGDGPPLHYHENEDETFLVQEGRISFYGEGRWREVEPGTIVFAPKRSVHSLKNVGTTTGRILVSASPAGFETFFARCAEVFSRPGAPDMARIIEISAEHGIHYVNA